MGSFARLCGQLCESGGLRRGTEGAPATEEATAKVWWVETISGAAGGPAGRRDTLAAAAAAERANVRAGARARQSAQSLPGTRFEPRTG